VDACPIDSTGEKLLAIEDPVAVVQPQDVELLVQERPLAHAQIVSGVHRSANAPWTLQSVLQDGFGCGEYVLLSRFARELLAGVSQRLRELHDELLQMA
jgi:hypothetical protein